jgi:hypothetical protein
MHLLSESAVRVLEIETMQDEALRALAELETRLERLLAEAMPLAARPVIVADDADSEERGAA